MKSSTYVQAVLAMFVSLVISTSGRASHPKAFVHRYWTHHDTPPRPASFVSACHNYKKHGILSRPRTRHDLSKLALEQIADDDLVALPFDAYIASTSPTQRAESDKNLKLRLCVIRNQRCVFPLVRHEDDVETDLFLDPRYVEKSIRLSDVAHWSESKLRRESTVQEEIDGSQQTIEEMGVSYYGVGWYGQRPVPSLGGGPGYGADATEVWSIEEDTLERLFDDGVDIPVIDVGIAHGEKARGGALF